VPHVPGMGPGAAVSSCVEEVRLTKAIVDALGVWAARNNTGTAKGGRLRFGLGVGSSDVVACVGGRFLALEVKMPGQRPKPEQVEWSNRIRFVGGRYVVAETVEDALHVVCGMLEG
jgi:hypothetical protein